MKKLVLPVDAVLPELIAALSAHRAAVLTAPPGSGKTTRAPPALLDAGLAGGGRVLVLQPRRVAARLTAQRIAQERGSVPGGEVGWRVRFEDRTSAQTRLEVLTEGLLTRRLQSDPFLDGVGVVVLDEFHERSLHADLALAMLAEVQEVREDLRILIMSATLDPAPIVAFFNGDCPVITAGGRPFPVTVRYLPRPDDRRIEDQCVRLIRTALSEQSHGHVLVFLPGVGEIERVRERLGELDGVAVMPLHGRLPAAAQDAALAPSSQRKVVLATNIAETSVTLAGVSAVVDSGLQRRPRFDPALGLTRLEKAPISAASAEQRAGRAGRTGPGVCYRLWTARQHALLPAHDAPAIAQEDLARPALEVLSWGGDPRTFRWFEPPPEASLGQALALLELLGAVEDGELTAAGEQLARLPLHPRLGRVILAGHAAGSLRAAATAAALVSERDPWSRSGQHMGLLERIERCTGRGLGADRRALSVVRKVRDQLIRVAGRALGPTSRRGEGSEGAILRSLIAGFPDRVGQQRQPGGRRYLLASGRGVMLDEVLPSPPLLVAASLTAGARGREPIVRIAAALEAGWLTTRRHEILRFDPDRKAVVWEAQQRYGALLLSSRLSSSAPDPAKIAEILAEEAAKSVNVALNIPPAVQAWQDRASWLSHNHPELGLPDVSDVRAFLPSWCLGRRSFAELWGIDVLGALRQQMTWQQQVVLDREAPERLKVPSGSRIRLIYESADLPPILPARIQQLFGMEDAPRIAGGRVAVRVHLLSPNNRP
ncbi:MAG: ATP-dependent helicase HrpB, partial [Myxococcota bacterium]